MTEKQFAEALVGRLKIRAGTAEGDVYTLDLRHRKFGNKNPRIVRCPDDAGWPIKGRPTSDRATAEKWVRDKYAPQIFKEIQLAKSAPAKSELTFQAAAERYIERRVKTVGKEGLRSLNPRISMLRVHVIPAIGRHPLPTITKALIRQSLEEMTVSKPVAPGKREKARPERGTMLGFVRAAVAVWKATFPDDPCPYAGIHLDYEDIEAERRRVLAEGDFETLLRPASGAMRPTEFSHALAAALYYDTVVGGRRNLKSLMIANTVHAMVIQTALGLRISELRMLRWAYINFEEKYVLVTGTKTRRSFRVVPLQEKLVPWLLELRELQGGDPDPKSFLIRTNAKASVFTPAAVNTLIARFTRALKHAGLKQPKKATHWARATHATWGAVATMISAEQLKAYLGHATRYGGATDDYIHVMLEVMPDSHRSYIQHIPAPSEVRESLTTFKPAELPHWKERRAWQSRSKTAKEESRARGRARKPMHERLSPEAVKELPHPVAVAFGFAEK